MVRVFLLKKCSATQNSLGTKSVSLQWARFETRFFEMFRYNCVLSWEQLTLIQERNDVKDAVLPHTLPIFSIRHFAVPLSLSSFRT